MTEPFPLTQCKTLSTLDFESLKIGDWIMEPKVDGWRMQFDVTPHEMQVWTRTQHDATGKMPWVEQQLTELAKGRHLRHLRLDGEVVYIDPDTEEPDYNYTARCLGSGTDVCVWKQQERGPLTYFVFDLLIVNEHDLRSKSLERRQELLRKALGGMPHVRVMPTAEPSFEQHTRNFEQYKEGSVLKLLSSRYEGKRHKSWMKWKEIETVDAKIIGYKEGQGKFTGLIGAIQFQAPDGTMGFCSGMVDDDRVWISNHRKALLGRVIEVKHFGRLVDGFRHPQFVRFREDKV